MSPAEFCRDLEAYLCRKNDGHLIRIVGPVFEKVCGWATQGVPLKVAYQGIDRYIERRQANGAAATNRRPVRVEFCEADILDAFDAWRRAIGVSRDDARDESRDGSPEMPGGERGQDAVGGTSALAVDRGESSDRGGASRRKTALHTHIDRVMARLTQRRVESGVSSALGEAIDRLLAELDSLRGGAKGARQEARATIEAALRRLDEGLIVAGRAALDPADWDAAVREARTDLESFRGRMAPDAYEAALHAATAGAFRTRAKLPIVSVED